MTEIANGNPARSASGSLKTSNPCASELCSAVVNNVAANSRMCSSGQRRTPITRRVASGLVAGDGGYGGGSYDCIRQGGWAGDEPARQEGSRATTTGAPALLPKRLAAWPFLIAISSKSQLLITARAAPSGTSAYDETRGAPHTPGMLTERRASRKLGGESLRALRAGLRRMERETGAKGWRASLH